MMRNSRLPDSLRGDLDSECAACRMGAERLGELFGRYGREQVEACFDAILDRTTETFRRELLAKIPDGTYVWEDYAEHDGVDPPRLHTQRITLTKRDDRLIIDFTGTGPQAKGPINHAGDYADGVFLKKWLAPILRNLADTPERMAELDVNEGVVPLIELRFPPPGTLLTPVFPAPTNARTFVILRLLGVLAGVIAKAVDGRMPADQETIRYTGLSRRRRATGSSTSCARCSAAARAGATTPTARTRSTSCPTARTCPSSSPRRGSRSWSSGSGSRPTRAAPASGAAGSATTRRSGCCATRVSVRRRPLDPLLLGPQGRQGGRAVPGHGRPRRPERARAPRARRRRADPGRQARPHRDDGRRRLGRSARARAGAGRARRARGQGQRPRGARGVRRGARGL